MSMSLITDTEATDTVNDDTNYNHVSTIAIKELDKTLSLRKYISSRNDYYHLNTF